MLILDKKDNYATLTIEQTILKGYLHYSVKSDTEDIYCFNNLDKVEDDSLRIYFFDLIKNLVISAIPPSVQFNIVQIYNDDPIPQPIERLPFPFRNVTIEKNSCSDFIVHVDVPRDVDMHDMWENKWNSEHFFEALLSLGQEPDCEVILRVTKFSEPYEWHSEEIGINILVKGDDITIDQAVNVAILKITSLVKKAEIKLSGLGSIFEAIQLLEDNLKNKNEKFWQKMLRDYSWLIANCFSLPIMVHNNEAYLGGKSIFNRNGRVIDFLYRNRLTNNLSLIEIKTPLTKIIGKKYRNAHTMSEDFTGAICQLLDYRDSLLKDYYSLVVNSDEAFIASNPQLLLIIGRVNNLSADEKKSFESFRQELKSIMIITFDELLEKVKMMLKILNNNNSNLKL